MKDKKEYSGKVRAWFLGERGRSGLSRRAIAARLGRSEAWLIKFQNGSIKTISPELTIKLAELFKVDPIKILRECWEYEEEEARKIFESSNQRIGKNQQLIRIECNFSESAKLLNFVLQLFQEHEEIQTVDVDTELCPLGENTFTLKVKREKEKVATVIEKI